MNPRALLLAFLLSPPVLAQEPVSAPAFDLHSDSIRKIVRETAATQHANYLVTTPDRAESGPDELTYVIPVTPRPKDIAPSEEDLAQSPPSRGFVSQTLSFLIDELIGVEGSEVEIANDLLRCRVQKETRSSPPGADNCPSVD